MARAESELGGHPRRLHYLSIPPRAFGDIVAALGTSGLADRARVVLEKPFGVDLESARELNALVHGVFPEERVFRIDHFLGREAVQNLIALRFANGMFEPVWNRDHIDHVQIDVPETLAVDDRAGFYEDTGAYRDMVVTHLFHVLGFVAMEPPTTLEARSIVEETGKVFRSVSHIDPDDVIRGQYAGYRDGPGVDAASQTETFIALRAGIDNWRWSGVPFFLRTGKRLGEQRRLLTIAFREPPRRMFRAAGAFVEDYGPDHISFDLGDPGGITTRFLAKVPGPQMRLGQARMEFTYEGSFGTQGLEPYERLMYDAMLGDRTLFTDAEGIESLWEASSALVDDPAAAAPLRARLLRTAEDARADRAAPLVAAGDLTRRLAAASPNGDPRFQVRLRADRQPGRVLAASGMSMSIKPSPGWPNFSTALRSNRYGAR